MFPRMSNVAIKSSQREAIMDLEHDSDGDLLREARGEAGAEADQN